MTPPLLRENVVVQAGPKSVQKDYLDDKLCLASPFFDPSAETMRFIIAFGKTISKAMSKHRTDPVCVQKIPFVFEESFAKKFLVDFISGVEEGFVLF